MDAVAYMAWERVVPWKILSLIARPDEPPVPVGFGSRNRGFQALLEPGSRIWVVTRISDDYSLAGRVTVSEILDRNDIPREEQPKDLAGLFVKWRFVARAAPKDSEFFETNNARPVLDRLKIKFAQNQTISYPDAPLEDSFKACLDQARETLFLSYCWRGGRRFAFALAKALRKKGLSPWLDALSIPGYKARAKDQSKVYLAKLEERLEKLIKFGIEKSKLAVAINTDGFAKTGWTKIELDHIRRKNIRWFQVMRGGRERKCAEPSIFSREPDVVAREILERWGVSPGQQTAT